MRGRACLRSELVDAVVVHDAGQDRRDESVESMRRSGELYPRKARSDTAADRGLADAPTGFAAQCALHRLLRVKVYRVQLVKP